MTATNISTTGRFGMSFGVGLLAAGALTAGALAGPTTANPAVARGPVASVATTPVSFGAPLPSYCVFGTHDGKGSGCRGGGKEFQKNVKTVKKCTAKTLLKKRKKFSGRDMLPDAGKAMKKNAYTTGLSIIGCSIMDGGKVQ